MRRWFLSYNSQDLGLVELESALRRKDPEAKVFFAPKSLPVGGFWLPELAQAISNSASRSSSHTRAAPPWHFGQCRLRQEL